MERQLQQVSSVELEGIWEEIDNLVDAVQKLYENRRYLSLVGRRRLRIVGSVAASLAVRASSMERMTKAHKVLFYQNRKAAPGAVERIQQQLRQGRSLRSSVPPVAAVKKNRHPPYMDPIGSFPGREKDHTDVRKPFRILHNGIPIYIDRCGAVARSA